MKIFNSNNLKFTLVKGLLLSCVLITTACESENGEVAEQSNLDVTDDGLETNALAEAQSILYNAETRFEYPKAIELFESIIAEDADNAQARFGLAYTFLKREQYDAAKVQTEALLALREQLSEKDNLWLEALHAKASDNAAEEIAAWEKVVAAYPDDRWAFYELGSVLISNAEYEGAAAAAEQALIIEPDSSKWSASWIYYLHSKALYRSGQYAKGVEAGNAGKDNPTSWRSTYFRMKLAELKGGLSEDVDAAIQEYIEISNAEGRNNASYTDANIALFYFELGDYQNAVNYAQKSFDVDPSAYQTWTLGYSLTENGQAAESLSLLEKGSELYPQDATVWAAKGWTLYRLGRYQEARADLLVARGLSARRSMQIEKNIQFVEDAISNPDAPEAPPIPWLG